MKIPAVILAVLFLSINYPIKGKVEKNNFITNPGFESVDAPSGLPTGWKASSPRSEISPDFKADNSISHSGKYSFRITSKGSPGTLGILSTVVKGIQLAKETGKPVSEQTVPGKNFLSGSSYLFSCWFRTSSASPQRNVWISITWLNKTGEELFTELISGYRKEGEWYNPEKTVTAPLNADGILIKLVYQWSGDGSVWWDDVSLEPADAVRPRKITVAVSSSEPPRPCTTEKNLEFYCGKVIDAGKAGADIICLGEGITLVGTGKNYEQAAETVPGPASKALGEAARKAGSYVVAGIYERDGKLIYNTALLIDRQGNIAGKYRKTHLPETEVEGGLMPGNSYPVFKTDFGTIGIEICYDNFFPEVARSLALNGAEIIFVPIWGDSRDNDNAWNVVTRARAIDNAVFIAASMYGNHNGSLIIDREGHILPDRKGVNGLIISDIEPDSRTFEHWLSVKSYGEWSNLFPQERRTETYDKIVTSGLIK
jgi:predicted amidohydrolase